MTKIEKEFIIICDKNMSITLDLFLKSYKDKINRKLIDDTFREMCHQGFTKIIIILLKNYDIDVNMLKFNRDGHGYGNLLHIASHSRNTGVLEILLSHKDINVNYQDGNGSTALMSACYDDRHMIVDMILERKGNDIKLDLKNKEGLSVIDLCKVKKTSYVKISNFINNR